MKVIPLDQPVGARVTGVDFRETPNKRLAAQIREVVYAYQVVIFPNQTFNAKEQLTFTKALGPIRKRQLPHDYIVPASS